MFYQGKEGTASKEGSAGKEESASKKGSAGKERTASKEESAGKEGGAFKKGVFRKKKRIVRGKKRGEQEWFRKEIYRHAAGLAAEMNLRLLLDKETGSADVWRELCDPDTLLFVEDIIITDIYYPKKARKPAFLRLKMRYWLDRIKQRRNRNRKGDEYGNRGTVCGITDGSAHRRSPAGGNGCKCAAG